MVDPKPTTGRSNLQRGTTALEVAIFTIAGLIVATIATVTMLNVSFGVASSGEHTAREGVDRTGGALELRPGVLAVRGDVDVDGDDSINLGGSDQQAIVKLEFTLTTPAGSTIDLTPPYTVDDSGTDPDAESSDVGTLINVSTDEWQVSSAAWSVSILGGDSDNDLEEGERALVTVWLHPYDNANDLYDLGGGLSDPWIDQAGELLAAREGVTVRMSINDGTGVEFERILPIELDSRILLD